MPSSTTKVARVLHAASRLCTDSSARRSTRICVGVTCTRGTGEYLQREGIAVTIVNKVREGRPHIVDMMKDGHIALVFNTTEGAQAISDSRSIRRTALLGKIPYSTTMAGARALVQAMTAIANAGPKGLDVLPLQSYVGAIAAQKAA